MVPMAKKEEKALPRISKLPRGRKSLRILITAEKIQRRLKTLAKEIKNTYQGRELIVVGVLKGAFIFMSDLIRRLDLPLRCDFLRVSTYRGLKRPATSVRIEFDLTQPITFKDVLLVEDIIDTGSTTSAVVDFLLAKRPRTLRICTMLLKEKKRDRDIRIDFIGFRIPDRFVVGYGLDLAGRFRNLPYVASVD
jgi:hypoxanthine phosphoribosyltransferase